MTQYLGEFPDSEAGGVNVSSRSPEHPASYHFEPIRVFVPANRSCFGAVVSRGYLTVCQQLLEASFQPRGCQTSCVVRSRVIAGRPTPDIRLMQVVVRSRVAAFTCVQHGNNCRQGRGKFQDKPFGDSRPCIVHIAQRLSRSIITL